MSKSLDNLVGKYAYKDHDGLFGRLVGKVELNESKLGISPLILRGKGDSFAVGAFPQDLVIVDNIEEDD